MTVYTGATETLKIDLGQPDAEDLRELADLRQSGREQFFRLHRESVEARRAAWNFLRAGEPFALAG